MNKKDYHLGYLHSMSESLGLSPTSTSDSNALLMRREAPPAQPGESRPSEAAAGIWAANQQ